MMKLYTPKEAADLLGISPLTLQRWRNAQTPQTPRAVKLGGARNSLIRYREEDLLAYIEQQTMGGAA